MEPIFLFKKILAAFCYPVPLAMAILFFGLTILWLAPRHKRKGKVIVTFGAFLMFVFAIFPVSFGLLKPLEREYSPLTDAKLKNLGKIPYIVVLGGGHISDLSLPQTSRIDATALVRLIEGIRLYRKIPGCKLVLSGGIIYDPVSNAEVMTRIAVDLGVPQKDILLERLSKDTKDEVRFLYNMIGKKPFILVTSASHMPRSVKLFQKTGMSPIPAPAGHLARSADQKPLFTAYFPNSINLFKSRIALHEYLGIIWAKIRRQI
jgi:uncharacterized SAM-binding protein YcdF (DUF218 family)